MCTERRGVCLVLVALLALPVACKRELRVSKGDELFSILDEAVLQISLRGPSGTAVAQRPSEGSAYSFSRSGAGGATERCAAPKQLETALAPVQQIRVRDVVAADKAKALQQVPSSQWVQLEVRDSLQGVDPYQLRLLESGAPAGLVFAQQPRDEQVVLVDRAVLNLLSLHCAP